VLKAFAGGHIFGTATGSGIPWVLALHGWRRTHADFAGVLGGDDPLAALALDLPGFGSSPEPAEPGGAASYAAAVAPVLDGMADRIVVIGHSFGGRVAVHLAESHPHRVAGLVLTGVPLIRKAGPATKPALGFRVGRFLHRRGLLGDDRMEALRRKHGSADYAAASGVMRQVHVATVNESYEDQLRALSCPVEMVWGDDDTAAPLAVAEEAAALVPGGARLTVLPGAGHMTPQTAPAELRAAVERLRP
jgi:pimeloyl-ACP methyl ester carboxylesterase